MDEQTKKRANIFYGLVTRGILEERQLIEYETAATAANEPFDHFLISKTILTEDKLLDFLSEELGMPIYRGLSDYEIPRKFMERVPVHFSRKYNIAGIDEKDGVMLVVTANPLDTYALDEMESMLSQEIELVLAPRGEITAMINKFYQSSTKDVDEFLKDVQDEDILSDEILSQRTDILQSHAAPPIIKLVNDILFDALKSRATDIHFQPYEERLQVRYRVDGILRDVKAIPRRAQEAVISRVKVMGGMDIADRRKAQDGGTTIKVGDSEVDIRISDVPTSHGERLVLRLLDKTARFYELEEIGLTGKKLEHVRNFITKTHGMVFVTGPTGSGKTTTLYAALSKINTVALNTLTIEDPIEYQLKDVSQIQVIPAKGLTFAVALRHFLRQDPDIIMVGEVRDEETAKMATQAALTGHLVLSTLHTNDAPGAIARLLHFGIEPYLVASSLIGSIAQRLVRLVCEKCKVAYTPSVEELKRIALDRSDIPDNKLYRGESCFHCAQTGYLDRTAIYEVLEMNERMRDLVITRESSASIKQKAIKEDGFETLRMDGALKVLRGITTIEEVLRVTQMDVS
ncbi:MAG: GspE/PulE family protein [Planctomycetota bacterium]|jgi:general secretion pathway protein E